MQIAQCMSGWQKLIRCNWQHLIIVGCSVLLCSSVRPSQKHDEEYDSKDEINGLLCQHGDFYVCLSSGHKKRSRCLAHFGQVTTWAPLAGYFQIPIR